MKKNKFNKYNRTAFLKAYRDGLRPDEPITVSEFAEKYIYLPENSAMPGLINLDITPYFRKPLDDLTPYNGIKKIVIIGCVQIGKSNLGIIFGTSMMKISPGNTMYVLPRIGDAEDFSTERVTPIIKASPILSSLIKMNTKSSDNKVSKKTYKGGFIYFVGASSAASFRSKPIRYLYMDEIDEYSHDIEGQGSPITLAENRTTTFTENKKIVYTSTPTDENSLINKEYEKGTKERYFVPCPHCGHYQVFDFKKGLKYKTVNDEMKILIKDSVHYECEHCKHEIKDVYKRDMLVKGEWRAEVPDAEFPSYRLNALYSPFMTWIDIVQKYLYALTDRQELKSFTNTYLGEIWIEDKSDLDPKELYERAQKSQYKQLEIPPDVVALTGAVDVQDNRLVLDIRGWAKSEKQYVIFYKEFFGDLNQDDVWNEVKRVVEQPFTHPSGTKLYIRYCAMDQGGHYPQTVKDFCSRNPVFKVVFGSNRKQTTLISAPKKKDVHYKGTYKKGGVDAYSLGTEIAKDELFFRLKIKGDGPKSIQFNKDLDLRFFEMLLGERLITKYVKGFPHKEWVVVHKEKRNEPWDTSVYNFCIARGLCHVDLLDDMEYDRVFKELYGDYGVKYLNQFKTEEELIIEENKKKVEIIEKLSHNKKGFVKKSGSGYMNKYKR